jgi:hypothetical protein
MGPKRDAKIGISTELPPNFSGGFLQKQDGVQKNEQVELKSLGIYRAFVLLTFESGET